MLDANIAEEQRRKLALVAEYLISLPHEERWLIGEYFEKDTISEFISAETGRDSVILNPLAAMQYGNSGQSSWQQKVSIGGGSGGAAGSQSGSGSGAADAGAKGKDAAAKPAEKAPEVVA